MVLEVLRYAVFAVFAAASGVAVGAWAVRTRRISPFSRTAGMIRRLTDPVLRPVETQLVRRGGSPHQAPWWLLGITVVGGIVVISAATWIYRQVILISRFGPRPAIFLAGQLFSWALVIRVIGSWFGVGRHNRFMRPFYLVTDWLVEPLRRVIPPIGMIDISPLVAWLLVQIALGVFL